jgi:type I restriction enzyme S subunit
VTVAAGLPGWAEVGFDDLLRRRATRGHKVQARDYLASGRFPVIDQGQRMIAGYSDREDLLFRAPPEGAIVFGDHTRITKYVDFDFLVGADGTQLLLARRPHHARFLSYLLELNRVPGGGYSRHFKHLQTMRFEVPPPDEQAAIADVVADFDAQVRCLERLVVKHREIRQAVAQELLSGERRLPGHDDGNWELRPLSSLGSFLKGRGIRREDVRDEGTPCIRYGELYTRYRDYVSAPVSRVDPAVAATALPMRRGDLLFTGSGETATEIGTCVAYVGDGPAVAGGDLVVLRPHSGHDPVFLGCLMNSAPLRERKARLAQGNAVVHVSSAALASIEVAVPPGEEQSAIATVITDLDAETEALEARLTKTRQIRLGVLQELVGGKRRLREEVVL